MIRILVRNDTNPLQSLAHAARRVAGLCQIWALAMGTISTLEEAHLFSRGESVVDDVEGVLTCDRHLVEQPHGRQYAPKSVRAGFKVGVGLKWRARRPVHLVRSGVTRQAVGSWCGCG